MGELSPTLLCEVTAVRGINNSVDITWHNSSGSAVKVISDIPPEIMDRSRIYRGNYTVSDQLRISSDGEVYSCEVEIDSDTVVTATSSITLDVIGKIYMIMCIVKILLVYFLLYSHMHGSTH